MCKKTMPTPKNEDTSGDQGLPFISICKEVRPLWWAGGRITAIRASFLRVKDTGCRGWGGGKLIWQVGTAKRGMVSSSCCFLAPSTSEAASSGREHFLIYVGTYFSERKATEGAPFPQCPVGFWRKEAGMVGTSRKERREKTLLSLIWTVYPSPTMIQISHYWIMQKQLFYLRSLLCFLNLFSARPNELSELSDSSKEWQMSRLCCCCCYFARNTWCV